jgi:hypothetical protein
VVRESAVFTAFDSRFQPGWIASAIIAQSIEGTIAKQAIEFLDGNIVVAGKVFTFLVLEKRIFGHFDPP